MYESMGFAIFTFSAFAVAAAVLALLAAPRNRTVRAVALRVAVVFGVFTATGGYIWMEIGPVADLTTNINDEMRLPLPPPKYMWV